MSLSDYNNKLTLEYVLSEDAEGQYFDRKSSSIKLSQLAKTIIAFANADGGTVAIGIKDRLIEGINDQGNIKINDFIQCGIDQ
jgi:ATP-dependent DNA helicase RecG